jgi:hypothetical protein
MPKGKSAGKPFSTLDCETDPFLHGRVPKPFVWGVYDGGSFQSFDKTSDAISFIGRQERIFYAHNGGKFDFHFLLEWFNLDRIKIINSRIVQAYIGSAELRDSYAIIPEPLDAYRKTEIDYGIFEAGERDKPNNRRKILSYLRDDCVNLHELVDGFTRESGRKLTLASNALAHSKKLDIDPGKTARTFDHVFRRFYAGGRCQAFRVGTFGNVSLYDIKSAYPHAMTFDHPTGDTYKAGRAIPKNKREAERGFYEIECHSRGAFWQRNKTGGLDFPHTHGTFFVTGWELLAAIEYGLIDNLRVLRSYHLHGTINFRDYVRHWFAVKEAAGKTDRLRYLLAKKMLNALYGKLAQNPEHFYDYRLHPRNSNLEDGWALHGETEHWELHARLASEGRKERYLRNHDKTGWESFNDTFPQFYNVATAASITGFVRAALLRGIARAGSKKVVYCDTDSLFVTSGGNDIASAIPRLGDFGTDGVASVLHIAGKKLYAARLRNKPAGEAIKIASKGCKLSFTDVEKLVRGGTVEWASEAPNFAIGKTPGFVVRRIAAIKRRKRRKNE